MGALEALDETGKLEQIQQALRDEEREKMMKRVNPFSKRRFTF